MLNVSHLSEQSEADKGIVTACKSPVRKNINLPQLDVIWFTSTCKANPKYALVIRCCRLTLVS